MKRKHIVGVLVVFLICYLSLAVYAHPGRTDSQGGHYDQGTGEYHYHHGYPAHDHYDMDGDGILDCPYDFEDRTGDNSGDNSIRETLSQPKREDTENYEEGWNPTISQILPERGAAIMEIWKVCVLIAVFCIVFMIMSFIIRDQIIKKQKQKVRYEKDIQQERAMFGKYMEDMNAELIKKYGISYLYNFCDTPPGDYVGSDGLPTSQLTYNFKWGVRYTFYLGGNSTYNRKYHRPFCRYANSDFPINALSIKHSCNHYTPCSICHPSLPDTEWVNTFLRYKKFFTTYNVPVPQELPAIDINKNPNLGDITREYLENEAIAMGVPVELALKIINSERAHFGVHSVNKDILTDE